eukprot:855634-Rhodomonas_salina.1
MKKRKRARLESGGAEDTPDPMAWRKLDDHNIDDIRPNTWSDYWPDYNGRWLTECVHLHEVRGKTMMTVLMVQGPNDRDTWTTTDIHMSAVRGQDFSIRAYTARDRQQRTPVVRINTGMSSAFTVYTIISTITRNACLADHDSTQAWTSGISESLEPKNQKDTLKRFDTEKWLAAEHVELRTCFDMGTFEIVDKPKGCNPTPSMFTYKLKTWQMNLSLMHWDIKGAYMCADLDQDLYIQFPPGY